MLSWSSHVCMTACMDTTEHCFWSTATRTLVKHTECCCWSRSHAVVNDAGAVAGGTGSGMTTHWLSLDLKGNVKYGQGYAMQETVMLAAHLPCSGRFIAASSDLHRTAL